MCYITGILWGRSSSAAPKRASVQAGRLAVMVTQCVPWAQQSDIDICKVAPTNSSRLLHLQLALVLPDIGRWNIEDGLHVYRTMSARGEALLPHATQSCLSCIHGVREKVEVVSKPKLRLGLTLNLPPGSTTMPLRAISHSRTVWLVARNQPTTQDTQGTFYIQL